MMFNPKTALKKATTDLEEARDSKYRRNFDDLLDSFGNALASMIHSKYAEMGGLDSGEIYHEAQELYLEIRNEIIARVKAMWSER